MFEDALDVTDAELSNGFESDDDSWLEAAFEDRISGSFNECNGDVDEPFDDDTDIFNGLDDHDGEDDDYDELLTHDYDYADDFFRKGI